jgi:hypothetical protein
MNIRARAPGLFAPVVAAILAVLPLGCTGVSLPSTASDTSTAYEPPPDWEAAILFTFVDSARAAQAGYRARVEFFDGARVRSAASEQVFHADNGMLRTPWYRAHIPAAGAYSTMLRITLTTAPGEELAFEYPLMVKRGEFYFVQFDVYTHTLDSFTAHFLEPRSYAVPSSLRRAPTDSLWIMYRSRGRYCFNCPS